MSNVPNPPQPPSLYLSREAAVQMTTGPNLIRDWLDNVCGYLITLPIQDAEGITNIWNNVLHPFFGYPENHPSPYITCTLTPGRPGRPQKATFQRILVQYNSHEAVPMSDSFSAIGWIMTHAAD
ncbi:hypothetical protein FRB94_002979 [Tulasnella sp. JGI-2019a]|nr:hypothetical protein FRB94_002979 [Tulasnella sp. JGI-2019a]